MMHGLRFGLFALGAMAVTACGSGNGDGDGGVDAGPPPEPTWAWINDNVIPGCSFSSCHGVGNSVGEFVLADQAYANLVGVPADDPVGLNRVEAGDPASSYMVFKLEGKQADACTAAGEAAARCGITMPKTGGELSAEAIQAIKDWITAGASET